MAKKANSWTTIAPAGDAVGTFRLAPDERVHEWKTRACASYRPSTFAIVSRRVDASYGCFWPSGRCDVPPPGLFSWSSF